MRGKRINEFDVVVTANAGQGLSLRCFMNSLKRLGFRAWKIGNRAYQVSFDGHEKERAELLPVGSEWVIG